jgi:peptide/nickel transport system permease protein
MIESGAPELTAAAEGGHETVEPTAAAPAMTGQRRSRRRQISLYLAFGWIGAIALAAIFAPLLPIESYDVPVGDSSLNPGFRWPEPLGTDRVARSILSRLVYGARQSLVICVGAVLVAFVIGGIIGTMAGYFKGWTDRVVSVLVDSFLALPPLVVLLALVAALRPSTSTLVIGLGVVAMPGVIRVARAQALNFSQRDYIHAAKVMGATHSRIMRRYIGPSVLQPLTTFAVIQLSVLMIAEGSLSFLGVGVPPPKPSWGEMIASGQSDLATDPHMVFVPGIVFLLTIVSLNVIGEWSRQRRSRSSKVA